MSQVGEGLPGKAARGARLTLAGQIARTVIQSIGVVVLARLLTPADFGLVAMVVAVAGLGEVIRELGLGIAAIQAKVLTTQQRDNLFWANTLLGCLIGVACFALSWPLAKFYGDDRLIAITQCVAITFLFSGMATQYRAGLQRSLKYVGVVTADVLSMLCGVLAAVALAYLGWGYWSIVVQQIIQPIIAFVIVVAAAPWLPGRMRRRQGTRALISSGSNIFAYHLLNYASRNIDTVLVGSNFGPTAAGYYSRAFQLMSVPLSQFLTPSVRIAVSVLSRLQEDYTEFARYLRRAQDALFFVCLSVLSLLYGLAPSVVELLLGPDWDEVVPIFETLAVAGVFQVLAYPLQWAFLALGHTRANLLQAVVARCMLIAAVVIGSLYSVQGVAVGYALGTALAWPIALIWLARVSPLQTSPLFWSACRYVAIFLPGGVLVSVGTRYIDLPSAIATIALGLAVMTTYLAAVVCLWPAFRRDVFGVYRAFWRLKSAKGLN